MQNTLPSKLYLVHFNLTTGKRIFLRKAFIYRG